MGTKPSLNPGPNCNFISNSLLSFHFSFSRFILAISFQFWAVAVYTEANSFLCQHVKQSGVERFHSRDQHLRKFMGTKESVYIRKEINSHRISLEHQHGRRFFVLGHQYGRRDVMWKRSIGILNTIASDYKRYFEFTIRRTLQTLLDHSFAEACHRSLQTIIWTMPCHKIPLWCRHNGVFLQIDHCFSRSHIQAAMCVIRDL